MVSGGRYQKFNSQKKRKWTTPDSDECCMMGVFIIAVNGQLLVC